MNRLGHVAGRVSRLIRGGETYIWDCSQWDVCLILDGLRFDALDAVADEYDWLPERSPRIWSVGSMSPEWISRTFFDRPEEAASAGLISANPFTAKDGYEPFPRLPVKESDVGYLDVALDEWVQNDDNLGISTVPPAALVDRTIDAWRRRDELGIDRLVVHMMQPHTPFISRPEWFGSGRDLDAFGEPERESGDERDVWLRVRDGELPREEVWEAYLDNLRWVLDEVQTLRRNCDATLAISSDHGQGLGEWGVWSHPPRLQHKALREVPMVKFQARDEMTRQPSIARTNDETPELEEKLVALGYR